MIAIAAFAIIATTVRLAADRIDFFVPALAAIAHGNVRLDGPTGTARADAAYIDLRTDRVVLAGNAQSGANMGDAIAIDLDRKTTSALDVQNGSTDGDWAFPDIDPQTTYIRAKRLTLVTHATARFTSATFPTSVGAPPVPAYVYPLYEHSGFSAQSLPGASFDQPLYLAGNANSLYSTHLRYVDGTGPDIAFDHHLVDGDRSYVVTSLDAPTRATRTLGLNAYHEISPRYNATLDASAENYASYAHLSTSAAFGNAGARLDYSVFSGGGATGDFALRSADRPFLFHTTYRLRADYGFLAQTGGVFGQLPDRTSYAMVWHHGIDAFIATPQVRGPLRTTIGATLDLARTWYAFPRRTDSLSGSVSVSRPFGRTIRVFGTYAQSETADHYGALQGLFYPAPTSTYITTDGTAFPGLAAFTGATTSRLAQLDTQWVTSPTTTFRLTLAHTDDFPQFHGYGRPQNEVRFGARFRPAPNFGIDVSRAYDFDWGGTRWVPRWQFSIIP